MTGSLDNDNVMEIFLSTDSASGKWQVIGEELVFITGDELDSIANEHV